MVESSKKDPNQIVRCEHDDESNSKRVMVVNTEMGMELSHTDGDSIYSIPSLTSVSINSGDVINISEFREYQVFSDVNIQSVELSPIEEGSFFFTLGSELSTRSTVFKELGMRLKVTAPGASNLVVVGRS